MKSVLVRTLRIALGLISLLVLWWIASVAVGDQLIPRPIETLGTLVDLYIHGGLLLHSGATLLRLSLGLILALLLALPLGIALGAKTSVDRALSPLLYLLYPLPKVAFLPLFMLFFGLGDLSKVLLLISVLFFQLIIGIRDQVKRIPMELHHAAEILGFGPWRKLVKLYGPASLAAVFSNGRIGVGIGMAVLFYSENYATQWGLGYFVMNSWIMANYQQLFAGILALGFAAALILGLIDLIQRVTCPWLSSP